MRISPRFLVAAIPGTQLRKHLLQLAVVATCSLSLQAQTIAVPTVKVSAVEFPDAPGAILSRDTNSSGSSSSLEEAFAQQDSTTTDKHSLPVHAAPTDMTIAAGQIAPSQTVANKMVGSLKDSISPFTLAGALVSAGYSHLTNGSPNYGTNSPAFAQRFGASMARSASQNIFAEGVMASILHEDPRYYQLGNSSTLTKRVVYAATRTLVTRTDSGRTTPNIALLSGYLGAAALTQVYYPPPNQGLSQVFQTYGGSIGGSALGNIVTEFLPGILQAVHLNKIK